MLGVGDYLWRLIPANPILLRVVEAGGKRKRDLLIRCGYLGLLICLVIVTLVSQGSVTGTSLTDLKNASQSIFMKMSYLQLALVSLLAPIFTAGAITQEKDSQTYDILLSTPLTNGQIVLGSLMSRLFFVIALLVSGMPIFSVTQIFGGVAIRSIVMSFLIAAATAFVTGALAMAIATFKVGTRRTIFSFYLFVVIYLVGLFLMDRLAVFHIAGPRGAHISWFTGIHPFLALRVILGDNTYIAPEIGQLPENLRFWPLTWYLTSPASFYCTFMFLLSFLLIVPSIVMLRRMAQATSTFRSWILTKLRISSGDRTRKPRYVWHNPIAWREAKTKASAARASLLRYGFIAAGLLGALVLVILFASAPYTPAKYIDRGSYSPSNQSLFVHGEQTYGLTPQTVVTLGGNEVAQSTLSGKYEVTNTNVFTTKRGVKTLRSIDLRELPRRIDAARVRQYLLGAVILEFAVILLIVTNAAASTVTREKEDGSLDLLLTTPITSRYYIWGKLRGLVSFVLPLVAVPVISVGMFIVYDMIRLARWNDPNFRWIVFPEAILIIPGSMIIMAAFASILGMQMSLRCRTTVRAVMSSVGIVGGVCGALVICGQAFVSIRDSTGLVFASFSPFNVLAALINPYEFGGRTFQTGSAVDMVTARTIMFGFSWVAVAAYAAVVWAMYKSMVKNFDMTIRKQSR